MKYSSQPQEGSQDQNGDRNDGLIHRRIRHADTIGQPIDDATARLIASRLENDTDSALAILAREGVVVEGISRNLHRAYEAGTPEIKEWVVYLADYCLRHRCDPGSAGR